MKRSAAVVAALAALSFAAPALATTTSKVTRESCRSYAQQMEDAIRTHASAPKLDQARKLKSRGDKACGAGKYGTGVKSYKIGLKDLGVKPVRK